NLVPDDIIFFFFQAEDGIRDRNVTGVQTCALPISAPTEGPLCDSGVASSRTGGAIQSEHRRACTIGSMSFLPAELPHTAARGAKIGRASCRERVEKTVEGEREKAKIEKQRRTDEE